MNLVKYKNKIYQPLRQVSLCFLVRDNEILLAMKKRGFGKGKWNGVGGKRDINESILEAAVRETYEEIMVIPDKLENCAILDFYFLQKPEFNQQAIVYLSTNWKGEPRETEEMKPKWFNKNEIPYNFMWVEDKFWLPQVLNGSKIKAEFLSKTDDELMEYNVNIVNSFND